MHDGNAYGEQRFLTLGDRLRKHRLDVQLTQQEVADRAGLSARGLSDLERGLRQAPYMDTILRLADALGVDETERQALLALARKGRIEQQRDPPTPGNLGLIQARELVSAEPSVPGAPASTRPTTEGPLLHSHDSEGEHRPATILSCQLADARSAAERFGVDAVLSLMDRLIQQATDEIQRYDGTLTVISHDRFVAVFGAPIAHEDHARRAVLAALALQAHFDAPADPPEQSDGAATADRVSIRLRIGVHSGIVAFGSIASPEGSRLTTVGDTPDIAMALQAAAAPGTILLEETTADQVVGYIRLEPLEPGKLPGRKEPMAVWRATGIGPRRSPLEGFGARPLAPFVGRQREMTSLGDVLSHVVTDPAARGPSHFVGRHTDLAALRALFARGEMGHGQVVGIVGEPGVGKSRLLLEFRRSLSSKVLTYLEGRCLSYGTSTPFLPIVDLVRANSGIQAGDDSATAVERVRSALHAVGLNPNEHLPIIVRLLGLSDVDGSRTPEEAKAQTFQTLRAWALKGSQQRPLVVAIEDLHWIDATSEEYLASLVESLAGAPILLLCSWRPGYRPPWVEHSHVTQLSLQRLDLEDSLAVVQSVLGQQRVPAALVTEMLERAEGNPFFLEELARVAADQADATVDRALPETIQDVLLARMESLSAVPRSVLQTASVLGRDFPLGLLEEVWDGRDSVLPSVQVLQRLEFVYEQHIAPEPRFSFKHALTQEAAYGSLLGSKRRRLHRRVAEALQERFGDVARTRPELLAHHYTAAGLREPAIEWRQRAAERAVDYSANVEAISHFSQALELLGSVPESPARARKELELQIGLSGAIMVTRGYGAAETVQADNRARDLAEKVGEPGQLFPLLFRRWGIHLVQSQQYVARRAAEDFLEAAERYGDPTQSMLAHSSMGVSCLIQGEHIAGSAHLAQALELYEPEHHRELAFATTFEPGAAIQTWQSIGYWLSGQLDDSARAAETAFAAARAFGHTNTLAQVISTAGTMLAQMNRDADAFESHLRAAMALAEENEGDQWHAYNVYDRGWLLAQRGVYLDGITQMKAGIDELESIGIGFVRGQQLGWLAQAYAKSGQFDTAQQAFAEAFATTERSGELWWQPELHRLEGQMLLMQGNDPVRPERCFQSAVILARRQHSLTLELRAAVSLCRALAVGGRAREGLGLVSAVLARITGGQAARDVQEARAVLDLVS